MHRKQHEFYICASFPFSPRGVTQSGPGECSASSWFTAQLQHLQGRKPTSEMMDCMQTCPAVAQREPSSLSFQIAGCTADSLEENAEEELSVQGMCRNMRLMDNCLPVVVFSYLGYWIVRKLFILSVQTFDR